MVGALQRGVGTEVKRHSLQPYVWMLISSISFSWMVLLVNIAGQGAPWPVVALVRSLLPLILVSVWAKADGAKLVWLGSPVLWTRSIAGSISLVGTFYALTHMAPSEVQTLGAVFPIWVALLSWPLLGELPSTAVWLSVISAVIGVAFVQQPGVDGINPVALVVLGVSLFTALAMMGLHKLKHLDPRAVVAHFSGVSTLICGAAVLFIPVAPTEQDFELRHVFALIGVGITATIGQFFLTKAFTAGAPARVSVVSLTQVVFVLLLDLSLLGHTMNGWQFVGIVLILAPTAWIVMRGGGLRRVKPAPRPMAPAVVPVETSFPGSAWERTAREALPR